MSAKRDLLLQDERFPKISALYEWAQNYDSPSPWAVYLDLIGFSQEELGTRLWTSTRFGLGYLELDCLAEALLEYSGSGQDAWDYTLAIEYADSEED